MTDFPVESKFDHLPEEAAPRGVSAFLTIQEGCDKFCSFCVVPYTRGAEYSRPPQDILVEAARLARSGVRELTLLGQNVNAYHGEAADNSVWSLGRLIRAVADVPGIARIRYTTSHPNDMDDALIAAHRDVPALMPFLHLPVQSGSDRILARMNRKHTAAEYLSVIERIRAARPDIALSSDFIVGFPSETEKDFQATLDLIAAVGFAQAYSFKYSPRPGTPASSATDAVPEAVKSERLARLPGCHSGRPDAFQPGECRTGHAGIARPRRIAARPIARPQPLYAVRSRRGAGSLAGGRSSRSESRMGGALSLRGSLADAEPVRDGCLSRASGRPIEISFDDNRRLPLLFGQHNVNLTRIERQLGVKLATRGNIVSIAGPTGSAETARSVLTELWRACIER